MQNRSVCSSVGLLKDGQTRESEDKPMNTKSLLENPFCRVGSLALVENAMIFSHFLFFRVANELWFLEEKQ